jgi:putative DNA primase/helicase
VAGLFHIASKYDCDQSVVMICEGYATAVSIYFATELYVVAAMSTSNLKKVALKIRELLPHSKVILAADNDEAGLKTAKEALQALGANVEIIHPTECNDFNDVFSQYGSAKILSYFNRLTNGKHHGE